MLLSPALVLLSCFVTQATCLLSFINPPPLGKINDFTKNLVFSTGETVRIAWSGGEEGIAVSIVLYHLNQTTGEWFSDGDMEYIAQKSLAPGFFTWLVGTRKDLTVSNLFYLSIFQEGKGLADENSRYFNITTRDNIVTSTSSASLSTSSSSDIPRTTSQQIRISSTSPSPSEVSTSEHTGSSGPTAIASSHNGSSDNLPDSAKIGLGVGIPLALLIGAIAGFLVFRRYKKTAGATSASVTNPIHYPPICHPNNPYSPQKGPMDPYYAQSYEASFRSPVELR